MGGVGSGARPRVPGLTRNQQLHAIGNGVAAVAALRHLGNPNVWKDAA